MIVDPAAEAFVTAFKHTTTTGNPFTTPTTVAPIPTIHPTPVEYQGASEVGKRTLW